jgi:hypothetical protein
VFALLLGNWFLSESLEPLQWAGVGLTLVSIYLINQRDRLSQLFQFSRGNSQLEGVEAIAIEVEADVSSSK